MTENLFEKIMAGNSSNLQRETDIQIQEAQIVPNKMNAKKEIPIKIPKFKDKQRLLKARKNNLLHTSKTP